MTSPLDLTPTAAHRALVSAERAQTQSAKNARSAQRAGWFLVSGAIVLTAVQGFALLPTLVAVVAIGLVVVTQHRASRRERELWWHQARTSLVDALAERETVIDLRDPVPERSPR